MAVAVSVAVNETDHRERCSGKAGDSAVCEQLWRRPRTAVTLTALSPNCWHVGAWESARRAVGRRREPVARQLGWPGGQSALSRLAIRSATTIASRLVFAAGIVGMTDASAT